jgi:TonB family protein
MTRLVRVVSMAVVLLSIGGISSDAAVIETEGVLTFFRVLAGSPAPASGQAEAILVVPGTVGLPGLSPEQDATNMLDLMKRLKDTYRLGDLAITNSLIVPMKPGVETTVPSFAGDASVRATLLGFNESVATYGVIIAHAGKILAEPKISVPRGERAIAASLDGEAAPYLFVVLEPLKAYPKSEVNPPDVMPKLIHRVQPVYPPEARKGGIDGVVILRARIGTDGVVHDLRAFRSEPMGLTEAAIEAVDQWRYEPAKDASGRPVDAVLTVTISFLLDRSKLDTDSKK